MRCAPRREQHALRAVAKSARVLGERERRSGVHERLQRGRGGHRLIAKRAHSLDDVGLESVGDGDRRAHLEDGAIAHANARDADVGVQRCEDAIVELEQEPAITDVDGWLAFLESGQRDLSRHEADLALADAPNANAGIDGACRRGDDLRVGESAQLDIERRLGREEPVAIALDGNAPLVDLGEALADRAPIRELEDAETGAERDGRDDREGTAEDADRGEPTADDEARFLRRRRDLERAQQALRIARSVTHEVSFACSIGFSSACSTE
jgi:hypothetical protein